MRTARRQYRTVSLFCGLGGEHMGKTLAFRELGIFDQCQFWALNHWEIAVETLQRNFPHAMTYCEDITAIDARQAGIDRIDLLWASPSCTHFSGARGGKPREDQQRAHAMEVYHRWLKQCSVPVFLMENVKEFEDWGPLDEFGKPVKSRKGEYFRDFVKKLRKLGYEVEWRLLRAADYGDPTSRVRFFLQAVRDGRGIRWPEPTHRNPDTPGTKPVWKSAREHVIDWSLAGKSIYYRKKPLSENTIRRIKHGLKKYGLAPYLAIYHGGPDADRRLADIDTPLGTLGTSNQYALVEPFIDKGFGGYYTGKGESIDQPLPTVMTRDHNYLVDPFLVEYYGTSRSTGTETPLPTVTAGGNKHYLAEPFLIERYPDRVKKGTGALDINNPFPTVVGTPMHNIVEPFLVRTDYTHALVQLVIENEGSIENLSVIRSESDIDQHDFSKPFCVELHGSRFLVDITYRMLQPHELARAMGFPSTFKLETQDGKPLSKENAVKMIGNACPVGTVKALVKAVMEPRVGRKTRS